MTTRRTLVCDHIWIDEEVHMIEEYSEEVRARISDTHGRVEWCSSEGEEYPPGYGTSEYDELSPMVQNRKLGE